MYPHADDHVWRQLETERKVMTLGAAVMIALAVLGGVAYILWVASWFY